ncbi:hypothetical protein ACLB2K_022222 [Fragaria x ananassa]
MGGESDALRSFSAGLVHLDPRDFTGNLGIRICGAADLRDEPDLSRCARAAFRGFASYSLSAASIPLYESDDELFSKEIDESSGQITEEIGKCNDCVLKKKRGLSPLVVCGGEKRGGEDGLFLDPSWLWKSSCKLI